MSLSSTLLTRLESDTMFKLWKIQENVRVHGLEFAAKAHKVECKREGKPSNFDVFYYALFGKWPTR